MFLGAQLFNANISNWDVSRVVAMDNMFNSAPSFNKSLCGAAWVHSKATQNRMFAGSAGSISKTVCDAPTSPQRWLAQWQSATTSPSSPGVAICPKCGTFKKSGRLSCCAPGGAWYKNCGGAGDRDVQHSWLDGVDACTGKIKLVCRT